MKNAILVLASLTPLALHFAVWFICLRPLRRHPSVAPGSPDNVEYLRPRNYAPAARPWLYVAWGLLAGGVLLLPVVAFLAAATF